MDNKMSTKIVIIGSFIAIFILIVAQVLAGLIASGFSLVKLPEGICNIIAGVLYLGLAYLFLQLLIKKVFKNAPKEFGIPSFHIKGRWLIVQDKMLSLLHYAVSLLDPDDQILINALLSTSSMKKIKQTAVRIMDVAIESDLIIKNPFSKVVVPLIESEERRALTEEEIELITRNWNGHRFGHAAMIMLYAGLRRGELLALQWSDIDFTNRVIHISKAWSVLTNVPEIKTPKTKAGFRDVPIPSILYDALWSIKKKKGYVCPDTKGKIMTGTAYDRTWDSFMKYLNECAGGHKGAGKRKPVWKIDHITAHMLRHTYATMLFDAGVDVKSAQRFLGHADIEVTLSIYTHLTKFKEDQAVVALDEHIKNRYEAKPSLQLVK